MTASRTDAPTDGSQTARAEELVDEVSHRVEDWSDKVAHWVAHAADRAREEVEDIWAEAQSIRRGQ